MADNEPGGRPSKDRMDTLRTPKSDEASTQGGGTAGGQETGGPPHAALRAKVIGWRREFEALTGVPPSDDERVKAWQAAHGVPPTGLVRRLTIAAARAAGKPDAAHHGGGAAPRTDAKPVDAAAVAVNAPAASAAHHGHTPEEVAEEQTVYLPEEGAEPLAAEPSAIAAPHESAPASAGAVEGTEAAGATVLAAAPASAETSAAKEAATDDGGGLDAVTDNVTTTHASILHAEEIFRDVPANTVAKKTVFVQLNKAWKQERQAEAALANAKDPKAREKAEAALSKAKELVEQKTRAMKAFLAKASKPSNERLDDLKKQLRATSKKKDPSGYAAISARIAAIEAQLIKERSEQIDAMKHTEPGHESESVFVPTDTEITHHDFVFPDGQHVKVSDHVVAYATTVSFGVDSDGPVNHAEVKTVMQSAGLSSSKLAILQAISGFEGGFDTVNTYDRAKVTWGFVQWTGGSASDLTAALTIIKQEYPKAFARNFQAYGIDVVKNQIVITLPDGTPPIVGKEAADAIMRNPKLAAALAHAGRDEDVKKGEVKAAAHIEIDKALAMTLLAGKGHKLTAGDIITSEYGVGLLSNTFVHSGSGAAHRKAQRALDHYVSDKPYAASDEAWAAGAEAAILSAYAAADSDRAASLKKILKTARGSFTP